MEGHHPENSIGWFEQPAIRHPENKRCLQQEPATISISQAAKNKLDDSFTHRVWPLWIPDQRKHLLEGDDASSTSVRAPRTSTSHHKSKVWHWIACLWDTEPYNCTCMTSLSWICDSTGPHISDHKAEPALNVQSAIVDSRLWTRDEYIWPRECH